MVVTLALPAPIGLAQTPARQHFVLNVPVDPLQGDDVFAASQNPGSNSYLAPHPAPSAPGLLKPGGVLTQVPYPFRTVTGAIAWVNSTFGTLPAAIQGTDNTVSYVVIQCNPGLYGPTLATPPNIEVDRMSGLPWNGETFPIKIPDRVSIQGTSALNTIFDGRRLIGASPYPTGCSIFTVDPSRVSNQTFVRVFIDSVTIRGARGEPMGMDPTAVLPGAGVMIDDPTVGPGFQVELTVSNCFITDNAVGVAVSSPRAYEYPPIDHWVRLINNTFAWNGIGVWNGGDARLCAPDPLDATHHIMVVNCVFDSRSPISERSTINNQTTWYGSHFNTPLMGGVSGFEGLSVFELSVLSVNGVQKGINGTDYNAYEPSLVNRTEAGSPGGPFLGFPGWPNVRIRPAGRAFALAPRVNLTPYIQPPLGTQTTRFALYHNDLFWWYGNTPGRVPADFDRSPHDFRLLPQLSVDGGATWSPNPLIDMGVSLRMDQAKSFILVMRGYVGGPLVQMLELPGIPSGYIPDGVNEFDDPAYGVKGSYADIATYFCNDLDSEGYGNPRNFDHPSIQPDGTDDITDIGADEVGTLVIAGYINGSTIFSRQPRTGWAWPNPQIIDNVGVYFIGLRSTTQARPRYNGILGRSLCQTLGGPNNNYQAYDWWRYQWRDQVGMPSYTAQVYVSSGRFCEGEFGPGARSFRNYLFQRYGQNPTRNLPAFPAPLLCDFSSHLMMDISAFFGFPFDPNLVRAPNFFPVTWFRFDPFNNISKPPFQDAFTGNSYVRNMADDTLAPPPLNDQYDAAFGTDNESLFYVRSLCDTVMGTKNPPGTWINATSRLHFNLPGANPFDLTGSNPPLVNVQLNGWGIGDLRVQDMIPSTIDQAFSAFAMGWRINCEVPAALDPSGMLSNLQSFLGINWPDGPAEGSPFHGPEDFQKILTPSPASGWVNPIPVIQALKKIEESKSR